MPSSTLSPAMGTTCGRREWRGRRGQQGRAIFRGARVATVKGTLIRRVPSAFAGGRHRATLGRSVTSAGGSFPGRQTHRRQQVSSGKMRRGTSSACAKRTHSSRQRPTSAASSEDTSFTRFRDPCTSIVTGTLLDAAQAARRTRRKPSGLTTSLAKRWRGGLGIGSVKPTKVGENRQGSWSSDDCAARRASPLLSLRSRSRRRSCVMRQKRKVVMAIVPARKRESGT